MRRITVEQRRRALVRRHHLAGDAGGPEAVTRSVVALHATDPASVYLSVLARSATSTIGDVAAALYDRRSLVRWMAMRRTLFVFPRGDVPLVQAAVSAPLAAVLRRRLISRLEREGADQLVAADVDGWLDDVEADVERALARRGSATGAELAADVTGLRAELPARAPSDRPQRVTTSLLTIMGTDGRLVRGAPTGAWTSRHHRWEPVSAWWPQGLPELDPTTARQTLARRWLERFGPATVEDLQWWAGWTKSTTRTALSGLDVEEVDLHGGPGIDLADRAGGPAEDPDDAAAPVAALLPALDPTPMGWKHRGWFLGLDPSRVFDRAGNIGPTVWWDGQLVGSWAVDGSGEVRTLTDGDCGRAGRLAIDAAAERMQRRLEGTVVVPAVRTPLERSLLS